MRSCFLVGERVCGDMSTCACKRGYTVDVQICECEREFMCVCVRGEGIKAR